MIVVQIVEYVEERVLRTGFAGEFLYVVDDEVVYCDSKVRALR